MGKETGQVIPLREEQWRPLCTPAYRGSKIGRIMYSGKSVDMFTGMLIGGNVIHQIVYWDYSPEFFEKVKSRLEENNPGKQFRIVYSD